MAQPREGKVKNSLKPDDDPLIVVACALTDDDGRVLLQQRPPGKPMAGLWEFPGGKLERGETPEQALSREIGEELGLVLAMVEPALFASAPLPGQHLLLLLYLCRDWHGDPEARHASALRWVCPTKMHMLAMPPADYPLIDPLARLLVSGAQPVK